jgi:hypothetical protein
MEPGPSKLHLHTITCREVKIPMQGRRFIAQLDAIGFYHYAGPEAPCAFDTGSNRVKMLSRGGVNGTTTQRHFA